MKAVFLFLMTLLCVSANGQVVSGEIVDNAGQPVIGTHISITNSDKHAHSDDLGRFRLQGAEMGDTLLITHLGFKPYRKAITQLEDVRIVLQETSIDIDEIVISPTIDAQRIISSIDINVRPVTSSQEVLRQMPGLFIGQHAGGGKAEQIFLRGFDIDHGTDVALTVDGLPVNMVSHAHGQGYADLHFVIPETIDNIEMGKGPYEAQVGNFNTAGYVDFKTKVALQNSLIKVEAGQYNTKRLLSMLNLANTESVQAYVAAEYQSSDGPFDSPQNFERLNLYGRVNTQLKDGSRIGLLFSHFDSEWDASGQIPERSVRDGSIGRFGAIDDTEGGMTGRTNVSINYQKPINDRTWIKHMMYYSQYDFTLFSNFTFFLNDPINGDQIKQRENRSLYGGKTMISHSLDSDNMDVTINGGVEIRHDQSNENELSRTINRDSIITPLSLGSINETNTSAYASADIEVGNWKITPGVRVDYFDFRYADDLAGTYEKESVAKAIFLPKLSMTYQHNHHLQTYLHLGKGYHSNDSRVVVQQGGKEILPPTYGADLGAIWKPTPRLLINAALWYLHLDQEFVYVGDEGIVEPSGKTRRQGIDLSTRYQLSRNLYWHLDANYAHARSLDSESGADRIPLAPYFTMQSGIILNQSSGLHGSLYVRHMADRPADETNTISAHGYTVVDLSLGYHVGNATFSLQLQNALNTEWNEAQFATTSRLFDEADPVEEIHFTPGTPLFLRGGIEFRF